MTNAGGGCRKLGVREGRRGGEGEGEYTESQVSEARQRRMQSEACVVVADRHYRCKGRCFVQNVIQL